MHTLAGFRKPSASFGADIHSRLLRVIGGFNLHHPRNVNLLEETRVRSHKGLTTLMLLSRRKLCLGYYR